MADIQLSCTYLVFAFVLVQEPLPPSCNKMCRETCAFRDRLCACTYVCRAGRHMYVCTYTHMYFMQLSLLSASSVLE